MVDSESDGARLAGAGRRWTRRVMTVIIAALALAGFTAIVLYSYDTGEGGDAVPLISAEAGPHKARPEEPGGMAVPDQDKQVFSRLDPGQAKRRVERLLPPPEEVVAPPPPPRAMPAPRLTGVAPEALPAPVARPARSAAEAAPTPAPAKISAKELMPPAIEPPDGTAKKKQAATTVPAARPPARTAGESTAAKPRAPSAKAPSAAVRQTAALTRSYRIQLAAYRSEESVRRRWAELRRKHGDLLGRLRLIITRADLGPPKGVYYRMQAGPLADSTAALALCARIKRRKMGCLVVAP